LPLPGTPHQAGLDWVREDVGCLVENVCRCDQPHGAVAVRCPERLPPAKRRVERACDEAVEVLAERRKASIGVGHDQVKVVGEHAERVDFNPEASRRDREHVAEGLVGERRRAKQEFTLGTPARHQVGRTRKKLSW